MISTLTFSCLRLLRRILLVLLVAICSSSSSRGTIHAWTTTFQPTLSNAFPNNNNNNNPKQADHQSSPCSSRSSRTITPRIIIKSTQPTDIPVIADILATCSSPPSTQSNNHNINHWKSIVQSLFLKSDLEQLLSTRLVAIQEAQQSFHKLQHVTASNHDKLRHVWHTNDRLRQAIAQASQQTGEDNLWRHHHNNNNNNNNNHHLAVPPPWDYLRHVQMTAWNNDNPQQPQIVGFCEVALLGHPIQHTFTPAIANLVCHPAFRRQGIATKLLQSAHAYVQKYWNDNDNKDSTTTTTTTPTTISTITTTTTTMGLYVEQTNVAALALYQSMGYEIVAAVPAQEGRTGGDMWYMTRMCPVGKTNPTHNNNNNNNRSTHTHTHTHTQNSNNKPARGVVSGAACPEILAS